MPCRGTDMLANLHSWQAAKADCVHLIKYSASVASNHLACRVSPGYAQRAAAGCRIDAKKREIAELQQRLAEVSIGLSNARTAFG